MFALPSYANEGVPQALLQAMFARVPCVTTDAGAIPEIARDGDTAHVVREGGRGGAGRGHRRALADPARARGAAERAHAYVAPRYTRSRDGRPDGDRVPGGARRTGGSDTMIRGAGLDAATGESYFLRETIDRVVPSNGPNPAATADG